MNAIHYRCDDGGRGTKLGEIVIGKMKRLLRRWVKGKRASSLRQLHLHIDNPTIVIPQKGSEQRRRDGNRHRDEDVAEDSKQLACYSLPGYQEELVIPWSCLLKDISYKDELASLQHIFARGFLCCSK